MDPMQTVSYIGLVITTWDWITTLRSEYRLIWSHSLFDLSAAQILYILTRYSAFLCHVGNITFLHYKPHLMKTLKPHTRFCRIWVFLMTVTVSWTLGLLFINMMLRVYALYKRDPRIIVALVMLSFIRVLMVLTSWLYVLPKMPFTDMCIPQNVQPSELIAMMLGEVAIQGAPLYLTFIRGAKVERVARAERVTVLVMYLRRDGVISWGFITLFSSVIALFSTFGRNSPSTILHLSYPFTIAFIPSLGCHLFLQMRKQSEKRECANSAFPQSFELDSFESYDTRNLESQLETPTRNDDEIHEVPRTADESWR